MVSILDLCQCIWQLHLKCEVTSGKFGLKKWNYITATTASLIKLWVSVSVISEYYKYNAKSLLNWYRFCSQIQKLKCWNSGQRHKFLVFLCNTQLVFFTSHRTSQGTTSRQQTQRMMIPGTILDAIPYFMFNLIYYLQG